MRTLLKISIDAEAGNKAVMDGTLQKVIQSTMEKIKPEASYFFAEDGCRTGLMVFDFKDSSEIPGIVEPFFQQLNARVTITPIMNADDLQKGLGALQQNMSH